MGITEILNIESQLKKASALINSGNQLGAIQILRKLLSVKDAKRSATLKLADIYDKSGNTAAAIDLFNDYLDENPDDVEIIKLVSYYLVQNSLFKEAAKFIIKFDKFDDENIEFLKGVVNFYIKKYSLSNRIFNNFLDVFPESELIPSVYFYLARIYYYDSMFDDALLSAKKSLELFPNNAEALRLEAEIYFSKEMFYHADESIRKALKLNPSIIEWRHFQIKILLMLDEINKAEENLSVALDNSKSSAEILQLIGTWHLKNNSLPKAEKYFEKAKEINPKI